MALENFTAQVSSDVWQWEVTGKKNKISKLAEKKGFIRGF
jgi:hypothetical protein